MDRTRDSGSRNRGSNPLEGRGIGRRGAQASGAWDLRSNRGEGTTARFSLG